ncbi:branched-chain amino acid transport system II carrier protein [Lacticaseibacillus brantae]|uniref:Branched-chain amino acid transport system carrier protein n=1 Tax=Lacticaseibacillus brantae DSM 23927 TaxID=1423727 RepID=A0A0R2B6R9_9LACO|nr:branched-chain amino acid transport system II carrier protein [Lacticaseibacillus brantae]KRM71331.1 branched-chain amino acid transport protein [Lacticaseibacillus brantae DSM 23927]
MTKPKLNGRQLFFIGSMLFGLFFGAGNLIFPVFLGQEAGTNLWPALLGFLISGVGLPLLGVIAIGVSHTDGVFQLAKKVAPWYGYFFTIVLYLCLGPLFATPRLATISYEIGVQPFIGKQTQPALFIYALLFFGVAWWFSRKPSKIMDYVGKFLTPAFLIALGALLIMALVKPLGHGQAAHGVYATAPLVNGFTAGYFTMDALAALAFGIIVVNAIKQLGVTQPGQIARDTVKSGAIAIVIMAILYGLLALLGRNALGPFARATNGGPILANVASAYFGEFGQVLLAIIVVLACLKTAIGLITAFGDTMTELFPRLPYQGVVLVASVLPVIIANVGLDQLLLFSTPMLYFLYPLAITLILLGLLSPIIGQSRWLMGAVTYLTVPAAFLDALQSLPTNLHTGWVGQVLAVGRYLPGFDVGLGWSLPAVLGLVIGLILARVFDRRFAQ